MSVTTITDADLERLGLERISAAVWRRERADKQIAIVVRGGVRLVWLEQIRGAGCFPIVLDHIKTPEQLESLCRIILEAT